MWEDISGVTHACVTQLSGNGFPLCFYRMCPTLSLSHYTGVLYYTGASCFLRNPVSKSGMTRVIYLKASEFINLATCHITHKRSNHIIMNLKNWCSKK